ncbi:hypothetical protein DFP72DRAFT_135533 [Ephemerocybe angulata]|uniref:Uncharacterized protein n=1 Tax=Ephemerocybe angulata TaxID=980116 RepID=A0A8H6I619_9AGAR|nr:hypothetical protein DFP72DRAFT_135533 [Tulosesus angulatus]
MSTRPLSATFNRQEPEARYGYQSAPNRSNYSGFVPPPQVSEALGAFLSSAPTTNPRRRDDESMYGGETAVPGGNLARMDSYYRSKTTPLCIVEGPHEEHLQSTTPRATAQEIHTGQGMQGDASKFPTISLSTTSHRLAPSHRRRYTHPNPTKLLHPTHPSTNRRPRHTRALRRPIPITLLHSNYHPLQQVPPAPTCLSTNRLLNRTPGVLQLPIHHLHRHSSYRLMRQVLPALIIQGRGHHLERRALSDVLVLGAGLATTAGSTNRPQAQHLYPPP